jgi:EmrB/QacA subfamily drug resistance transporter
VPIPRPDAPADRPSARSWVALVVAISTVALLPLAVTGTNLAFPAIEVDFPAANRSTLSWVLTGYSIALAAFMLLGGQLVDRSGARRLFLVGVAAFTVGAVASGLAPNPMALIAARVLQGVGGSAVVPASLAVVLPMFPAARHPAVIGAWAASMPIGSTLAPTVAALVLEVADWRWVFLSPVPVAVAALALGPVVFDETPRSASAGRTDWLGVPIGTMAVALLALGIVQLPRWGWASPSLWAVLAGAAALGPLFLLQSRRHPRPLLELSLFTVPTMRIASLANLVISMAGMSVWLLWPLLLTNVWGYSLLATGLAITPTPAIAGVGSILAGVWATTHGYRGVLLAGTTALVAGNVWFVAMVGEDPAYWRSMLPGLVLFGTGFGLTFAPLNGAALADVGRQRYGQANAAFNTVRNLSGALGIAAVVAVLGDGDPLDPIAPFHRAFTLLAGLSLVGLVVVALLWPRRERVTRPT